MQTASPESEKGVGGWGLGGGGGGVVERLERCSARCLVPGSIRVLSDRPVRLH